MANLASGPLVEMNDVEIDFEAGLSETLFIKMGQNINGLINRSSFPNSQTFTSSGNFVVPTAITRVLVVGAGGGGAGGRGGGSGDGGNGGYGAVPQTFIHAVTPAASLTVTIGAGGASNNLRGGNSIFDTITFYGAKGGGPGYAGSGSGEESLGYCPQTIGGVGDIGGATNIGTAGQSSPYAAGGAAGASLGASGAGGAGWGAGAASQNGPGNNNGIAAAANTSAGGSGGANNANAGAGGSGKIIVYY